MTLPIVMPTNLRKMATSLENIYPGRMALLLSPDGWTSPRSLPYALDNGRFPVWSSGKKWDERKYFKLLDRAEKTDHPPKWIVVPDSVGNAKETFTEWAKWTEILKDRKWPFALAVQDGMTPEIVRRQCRPLPEVIFVGGTTEWKWKTVQIWTREFLRVHVGRVNTGRLLWRCHRLGVESSDGTGWFHHVQYKQLVRYLSRSSRSLSESNVRGFFLLRRSDDEREDRHSPVRQRRFDRSSGPGRKHGRVQADPLAPGSGIPCGECGACVCRDDAMRSAE